MTVSYDGTRFHGFQRQVSNQNMMTRPFVPKRPRIDETTGKKQATNTSVQESIEQALCMWTGLNVQQIGLLFAGRTDSGVHAKGQVIAVYLSDDVVEEPWKMQNAINSRLPTDISVQDLQRVSDDFHPRQDVAMKQYSYTIKYRRKLTNADGTVLPICQSGPQTVRHALDSPCLWVSPWSLDDSLLPKLCAFLQGKHNFYVFIHKQARNEQGQDPQFTLDSMEYEILSESSEPAPVVTGRFVLRAKSFRRSMVRNLVGFCIDVCRGKEEFADFTWNDVWKATQDVAEMIHSTPGSGLCLDAVSY